MFLTTLWHVCPPPIPFPGLRICIVGKVTHGKAEPVTHSKVLFSCSACLAQIYRKQPHDWQMSSPGTAMANTFQKPICIFPLPYSLLAWGFSPVAASDGKHLLFYEIIACTQIIPHPQKSLLGRSLAIYTLNQMCWKNKTTISCCITFFVIKKAKRKPLVRVEHINYDKTSWHTKQWDLKAANNTFCSN